jgi:hypothetical protein
VVVIVDGFVRFVIVVVVGIRVGVLVAVVLFVNVVVVGVVKVGIDVIVALLVSVGDIKVENEDVVGGIVLFVDTAIFSFVV